jgi:hypothetical protein
MKVRLLRNVTIGRPDTDEPYSAAVGDEVELTQETGEQFVGNGTAERIEEKPKEEIIAEAEAEMTPESAAIEPPEAAVQPAARRRRG